MSANRFLIQNFVSVAGIEIKKESQIIILFRYCSSGKFNREA